MAPAKKNTSGRLSDRIQPEPARTEPKDKKMTNTLPQNVKLGVSGRAVKRWRGERRGSSLNLEENSMFPGLVRLVSMVLLVSMVFH